MVPRNTRVILFLLVLGLGVIALPQSLQAQMPADRFQQILNMLKTFGDVSASWSRALPANERFVVLPDFKNEAVLDRNTGLVWEKSPHITERPVFSASYHCMNASVGGQKGWRLPNITELMTLVDPASTAEPMLPAGAPFELGQRVFFLSGTKREGFTDLVWYANLRTGAVDDIQIHFNLSVLCVRGGPRVDAY